VISLTLVCTRSAGPRLTGQVEVEQFVVVLQQIADSDGAFMTEFVLRQVLQVQNTPAQDSSVFRVLEL